MDFLERLGSMYVELLDSARIRLESTVDGVMVRAERKSTRFRLVCDVNTRVDHFVHLAQALRQPLLEHLSL